MAHLEFCIPATSRDELVQSSKKGQYVVRRILKDPSEIEQKVEGRSFIALKLTGFLLAVSLRHCVY